MRVPVIAGNWKMNTTLEKARDLVREMLSRLDAIPGVDKIICPPFVSLAAVKELIQGSSIKLGAQNLYFEEQGAYTGEVSPLMLCDLCQYVIIGHSERRQYFNETDEVVNKKIRAAQKSGLKPILCVGEKLEENEAGNTELVVTRQLTLSLESIDYSPDLMVAYEPIWAIGTGRAATGDQANETIGLIRDTIARLYDKAVAGEMRILYGGSVTGDNIAEYTRQSEIDGALVGGASLKADQFLSIVRQTSQIR